MITLYNGNSFQLIREIIASSSVDLVMTDVPYPDMTIHDGINPPVKSQDWIAWFQPLAEQIKQVLKPTGSFVTTFNSKSDRGIYFEWVESMRGLGFHYVLTYYWVKKNIIPGDVSKLRFPRDGVDFIAHLSLNKNYKADLTEIQWKNYNPATAVPTNLIYASVMDDKPYWAACKKLSLRHPGKYPSMIPDLFIRMLTDEGDVVLDPFNGTGTTTLVAEKLGRKAVGFELNPKNIALSREIYASEGVQCNLGVIVDQVETTYPEMAAPQVLS
jgi:site-specific DNA-methyltransferase (adenine-specific)/site-specific DNA-methyltransferase (cytosine-N4-specific)